MNSPTAGVAMNAPSGPIAIGHADEPARRRTATVRAVGAAPSRQRNERSTGGPSSVAACTPAGALPASGGGGRRAARGTAGHRRPTARSRSRRASGASTRGARTRSAWPFGVDVPAVGHPVDGGGLAERRAVGQRRLPAVVVALAEHEPEGLARVRDLQVVGHRARGDGAHLGRRRFRGRRGALAADAALPSSGSVRAAPPEPTRA